MDRFLNCCFCDERFVQKNNLVQHVKDVHGVNCRFTPIKISATSNDTKKHDKEKDPGIKVDKPENSASVIATTECTTTVLQNDEKNELAQSKQHIIVSADPAISVNRQTVIVETDENKSIQQEMETSYNDNIAIKIENIDIDDDVSISTFKNDEEDLNSEDSSDINLLDLQSLLKRKMANCNNVVIKTENIDVPDDALTSTFTTEEGLNSKECASTDANLLHLPSLLKRKNSLTRNKKVQCQLCNKLVKKESEAKHSHAVAHWWQEADETAWLYKCLLCNTLKNCCKVRDMRCHMVECHGVTFNQCTKGIDYVDQIAEYNKGVERIQCVAFPKLASSSSTEDETIGWKIRDSINSVLHLGIGVPHKTISFNSQMCRTDDKKKWLKKRHNAKRQKSCDQCQICSKLIRYDNRYFHAVNHWREQTHGISWVYKCLLCDKLQTGYRRSFRNHMMNCHHKTLDQCQNGVNYIDHSLESKDEIERVRLTAFPALSSSSSIAKDNRVGPIPNNVNNILITGTAIGLNKIETPNEFRHYAKQAKQQKSKRQRWWEQCQMCSTMIRSDCKLSHIISHWRTETGMNNWLYGCLLCNKLKTCYLKNIRSHMIDSHSKHFIDCQVGIDYVDQSLTYNPEIDRVRSVAFPPVSSLPPGSIVRQKLNAINFFGVVAGIGSAVEYQQEQSKMIENANASRHELRQTCSNQLVLDANYVVEMPIRSSCQEILRAETPHDLSTDKQIWESSNSLVGQPLKQHYQTRSRPVKKRRFEQCQLCKKLVRTDQKRVHTIMNHFQLKNGSSIWLYKCLLCNKLKTCHVRVFHDHMKKRHFKPFNQCKKDIDYVDQVDEYYVEIECLHSTLFPSLLSTSVSTEAHVEQNVSDAQSPVVTECQRLNSTLDIKPDKQLISSSHSAVQQLCSPSDQVFVANRAELSVRRERLSNHLLRTCQICSRQVRNDKCRSHVAEHLPQYSDVVWLYKCLICTVKIFETLNYSTFQSHMSRCHEKKMSELVSGVEFIDKIDENETILHCVRLKAFPHFNNTYVDHVDEYDASMSGGTVTSVEQNVSDAQSSTVTEYQLLDDLLDSLLDIKPDKQLISTNHSAVQRLCSPSDQLFVAEKSFSYSSDLQTSDTSLSSLPGSSTGTAIVDHGRSILLTKNRTPRFHGIERNRSCSTFGRLSKRKQFHGSPQMKRQFGCKFCDRKYSSFVSLKMHIQTHTLPCKCAVCGKGFGRPWLLQGHLRTHTGEKPFRCDNCGRAFADRSNLNSHLKTHSEMKRCKTCQKTFSRIGQLSKHESNGCSGL